MIENNFDLNSEQILGMIYSKTNDHSQVDEILEDDVVAVVK